eukprot:15455198-Alexandrium_andersonii.AAC.1
MTQRAREQTRALHYLPNPTTNQLRPSEDQGFDPRRYGKDTSENESEFGQGAMYNNDQDLSPAL